MAKHDQSWVEIKQFFISKDSELQWVFSLMTLQAATMKSTILVNICCCTGPQSLCCCGNHYRYVIAVISGWDSVRFAQLSSQMTWSRNKLWVSPPLEKRPRPQTLKLNLTLKSGTENKHPGRRNKNPAVRNLHKLTNCCELSWTTAPCNSTHFIVTWLQWSSLSLLLSRHDFVSLPPPFPAVKHAFLSLHPVLSRSLAQTVSLTLTAHQALEHLRQSLAHNSAEPGGFPSNALETQTPPETKGC